jgi:transcriptional regulator with XRE-family HTH domain
MATTVDVMSLMDLFLSRTFRAITISQRMAISPQVVDAHIVHATPEAAQWYGVAQPEGLVGQWQSWLQHPEDIQLSRQMALLRHFGCTEVPTEYVVRIRQGATAQFRAVMKQTTQVEYGGETYWVTRFTEPRQPLLAETFERQPWPTLDPEAVQQYGGRMSVAEMETVLARGAAVLGGFSGGIPGGAPAQQGTARQHPARGASRPPLPPSLSVGQRLRHAREAKHLSLRQVATQLRRPNGRAVSPQYLSLVEHDDKKPNVWLLWRLAQILDLAPAALLAQAQLGAPVVAAYLQAHPAQQEAVIQLFVQAQDQHFAVTDWQRVQQQLTALQHPVLRSPPLSPSGADAPSG